MQLGLAALASLLLTSACLRTPGVQHRREGRFGRIAIYPPAAPCAGLVFVFSDADGWDARLDRAGSTLAGLGVTVVGVDLSEYKRGLAASHDGCHYLISEVEDLSKRLQREFGSTRYQSPILAGIGEGGTLAYAALAQSPAATVAGAVSLDPSPSLTTTVPLCAGAPSEPAPGGGFRYGAAARLSGWWEVSPPDAVGAALRALATPEPAHGSPTERLLARVRAHPAATPTDESNTLADLPLVELPAAQPGTVMAVIYSGDGGWRDLDKTIGEALAGDGVPVVGVDSLRYFWRAKTPDEVAGDLARILRWYTRTWGTPKVVLIGYSFGAGVLPFAYNRLPADVRAQVVQVSLLGIEPRALFEFKLAGWLGVMPGDARAVLPEVEQFPPGLLQCVYGDEEKDTLCRDPTLARVEIVRTSGGHHFDGNYAALARTILAGVRRRLDTP